jgi:hypothetical protein
MAEKLNQLLSTKQRARCALPDSATQVATRRATLNAENGIITAALEMATKRREIFIQLYEALERNDTSTARKLAKELAGR